MHRWMKSGSAVLIALAIAGCASNGSDVIPTADLTPQETAAPATVAETTPPPPPVTIDPNNPLLAEWTGQYGGVPPFDQIKVEHFKPALADLL